MNINLKQAITLIFCIALTACATNTPSDRSVAHKEKIQTIYFKQFGNNIVLDTVGNASKANAFKAVQKNLNDFSTNAVFKAALEHNVLDGKAFSENLVVTSGLEKGVETSNLTPVLSPVVIMSSDYGVVNVVLIAHKDGQKNTYTSLHKVESHATSNKQYWVDNPLVLKEKIVNGLYDVAKQFSDDFNAQ